MFVGLTGQKAYPFCTYVDLYIFSCLKLKMIKTINKISKILFVTLIAGALLLVVLPSKVFAKECKSDGSYGEACIYNKSFELDKKVKKEGGDVWKDKITDVENDEIIEFEIEVENVGEVEVDDMRMEDFLPDELEKVGGSGLTEYWNNFEPGEKKTFVIKARIKEEEFNRDIEFEKCIANKAEVEYDGDFESSDTAVVCYGNVKIKELPETGVTSTFIYTALGLTLIASGIALKKKEL